MIKRLQRRFILIAMGSLLAVLLMVLGLINFVSSAYISYMVLFRLDIISDYEGHLMDSISVDQVGLNRRLISREFPYEARYFIVHIRSNGHAGHAELSHIAAVDTREARELAFAALSSNRSTGRMVTDFASYIYRIRDVDNGRKIIIFLDYTRELAVIRTISEASFGIGAIIYLTVFALVTFFSKRAIAPIAANYEKQKSFITNAGHELKTPLAIISANAEVLEMMNGENEWTQSITHQTKRMTDLVNNLVRLARMEEKDEKIIYEVVSFSEVVKDAIDPFETLIQSNGCALKRDIADDIQVKTDRNLLRELINILLDNAAKYCDKEGTVTVALEKKAKNVCLTVSNDYAEGEKMDFSKFFDRFYRADESHNSAKGGFGIGLSMADGIASALGAKLQVGWDSGMITFTVILPAQ